MLLVNSFPHGDTNNSVIYRPSWQCPSSYRQLESWEQPGHPPYSPDLAPRDFHLFQHLGSQWHDDEEHNRIAVVVQTGGRSLQGLYLKAGRAIR